jgi:hypothetical protein
MLTVIWAVAALLLLPCGLAAWGLHALLTSDPQWLERLGRALGDLPFAPWLDDWAPGWQALAEALLALTQELLSWAGAWAPWLAWLAFAAGALAVVGTAGVLSLVVVLLREKPKAAVPAASA